MKKIFSSKYSWLLLLAGLIVINFLASEIHFRFDLTQEKRYTLAAPTKKLLTNLKDPVSITVFLEGDMPAGFKKLGNSAKELLQEFKEYGTQNIKVTFTRPGEDSTTGYTMDSLMRLGLRPTNVRVKAKEGEGEEQRYLFPGAVLTYGDRVLPVDFMQGVSLEGGDPVKAMNSLNNVEALLEYKLISGIEKITTDTVPLVGYLLGNGEPQTYNIYDFIERTLKPNYRFTFLPIDSVNIIPQVFDAIVIVKPVVPFNDKQKLKIDQYIMNGGKVIWMIDRLYAEMDSLMRKQSDFIAFDRNLNLEDQLFKYGVRINPDLVQDLQCDKVPLVVGNYGDKPQMQLTEWPYFPLLNSYSGHPIAKNLGQVLSLFPNSIDTIKTAGISKTILLASSANSRTLVTPAMVSLNSVKTEDDIKTFNRSHIPIAVLLEGKFSSLYSNRLSGAVLDTMANLYQQPFLPQASVPTKMIVISDADIVSNVFSQQQGPLEMGLNQFTQTQYANKDFILNSLEYLVNNSGILETRSKDFTLRLLDPKKVESDKTFWQIINIGGPVLLILLFGAIFQALRKRKYQR
ncbi:MAG: gliding motility-associated ABC transporter substrate-binding protein GldG [Chitinophagaceae bacterium]|nr:gliding motility-associated ABC transporter substrate-binding protein GldG [Chitinophagaceae bacterium]